MIPVTQTKVVVKNSKGDTVVQGNCFAAAVASIMELPITEVPNVETLFDVDDSMWNNVMIAFIRSKGWDYSVDDRYKVFHPDLHHTLRCPAERDWDEWVNELKEQLKDKYYLLTGNSPRGFNHVCIYQNGIMVHDPHPTRDGINSFIYFETIEKTQS